MEYLPEALITVGGILLGWVLDRRRKLLGAKLAKGTAELQANLERETEKLRIGLQEEVEARRRHEQRGDLAKDVAIDELGSIVGSLARIAGRAKDLPEGETFEIAMPPELQGVVIVEE